MLSGPTTLQGKPRLPRKYGQYKMDLMGRGNGNDNSKLGGKGSRGEPRRTMEKVSMMLYKIRRGPVRKLNRTFQK